jgi:hypothetical protein
VIDLNLNDKTLIGKKYQIIYKDICHSSGNSEHETFAKVIEYSNLLMFSFTDLLGNESYTYLDEVIIIKEIN